MKQIIEYILDEIRSAWRFRWIGLAVAVGASLVGWLAVFTMPDRYQAKASVFVDTRTALKPVLQGLTMDQDVSAQLNFARQSLLSGAQVEKIARQAGVLGESVVDPRKVAQVLSDFTKSIDLDVRSASGRDGDQNSGGAIYGFSYSDGSRDRSMRVVDVLLQTFVEETLGGKREGSESAQKFLESQIHSYEERLRDAENRLADFKRNNIGLMPSEQGGYFAQLQTELDASNRLANELDVATSRRAELLKQLRGEAVVTASPGGALMPGGGASAGDTVSRIKETQSRLDDLMLRFTDKHPDVVAARANLEELKRRREAEVESLRRGDAGAVAASGVSSNPVYQSIQLALNQADVEIASLRGQLGQHRGKASDLRRRLDTAPEVEAQYAQLNRDYDINKAQYTTLLGNYEKARLGERADNAGSVRFEIVQPPTAPFKPISPRRSLLIVAVLGLAGVLGAALMYLLHLFNPVVTSVRSLRELTGLVVLGVVSPAFPDHTSRQLKHDANRFAAALGALALACALVLALNWYGVRLPLHSNGGG